MITNYYLLSIKDYAEVASAFAPEKTELGHELIPRLEGKSELPFDLELVKLSIGKIGILKSNDLSSLKNVWLDFQPNSLAWPLMSEKFKNLITNNLTGKESINWVKAKINYKNESRIYYILRFEQKLDVLDGNKTLFVKGTDRIIRPHFSKEKIKEYSIFNVPQPYDLWKITSGIYINERLKKEIMKEKIQGPVFEKISAS